MTQMTNDLPGIRNIERLSITQKPNSKHILASDRGFDH